MKVPREDTRKDTHSYSEPDRIRIRHIDLDLEVSFQKKVLRGTATLTLEQVGAGTVPELVLDTRDLAIEKVQVAVEGSSFSDTRFELGVSSPILGAPLKIPLPESVHRVRITYSTRPGAPALQWLEPAQTAGKKHPFLYTQSEAIYARSWIPLQDTPAVRFTYNARIRTPRPLLAVMSAENPPKTPRDGDYSFAMTQEIPSYLMALAVGDVYFKPISTRSGVYAEKPVLEAAAREFEDTEEMIQTVEDLFGPYRWGRYDLLVLPPSFPLGGMENPCLTFLTPTAIAGDKSLVSLVAHELSHSWAGNLVTNATWRDFWLNEGFTVYLEQRIQEKVYGKSQYEMEATLAREELEREMATLAPVDQVLFVDLKGRDPDDGFTNVPYVKGALFLRSLEEAYGRDQFDRFLRGYFDHYAFKSITTADFLAYLKQNLLSSNPSLAAKVRVNDWVYEPGLPPGAPHPTSAAFSRVEERANQWLEGEIPASKLPGRDWTTQEWLHFLGYLPAQMSEERMQQLDRAFQLTHTSNAEIASQWLTMAVRSEYEVAYPRLEEFLATVGRRKLLKPIYEEMVKTPEGKKMALDIFRKARPTYHSITIAAVEKILGQPGK